MSETQLLLSPPIPVVHQSVWREKLAASLHSLGTMVFTSIRITTSAGKRDEVVKTLSSLLGPTRVLPGCLRCRLYRDLENPNVVALTEEWESREALDRYVRSESYRRLLAAMDLASEPPEIQFSFVASTAGMELIEEIRS